MTPARHVPAAYHAGTWIFVFAERPWLLLKASRTTAPTVGWLAGPPTRLGHPRQLLHALLSALASSAIAPCIALPPASLQSCFALPRPSDRHGWRECKRIVGTILALDSSARASCFALPRPSLDSYLASPQSAPRRSRHAVPSMIAAASRAPAHTPPHPRFRIEYRARTGTTNRSPTAIVANGTIRPPDSR